MGTVPLPPSPLNSSSPYLRCETNCRCSIKFASVIYVQQLLDREHYLEWLIAGVENSSHAKLPFWLLLVQIYWRDILISRKYGRRFVVALLSHFQMVSRQRTSYPFPPCLY